jgi:hypothetical protein
MSKVESIERQIEGLMSAELAELREWFVHFDSDAWDRQMEGDAAAGKLDKLAGNALRDHDAGRSTEL